MSGSDLKEREETSADDLEKEHGSDFSADEKNSLESLNQQLGDNDGFPHPYENEGEKPKGLRAFVTKRKTLSGLIIGLLLGGSFGIASITQGPLQFIHIAQLLQRFHFSSVEDSGNGRMLKLYKYAQNKKAGSLENNRLSVLGNKFAETIDARYERIGLEKQFSSNSVSSTYEGLVLDPAKFAENAKGGEQFKGLKNEEFKAKFKEVHGVNLVDGENGKLFAPADSGIFAYFKNKSINSAMATESGFNKISGALATRVMGKRDGITWHPIKAADAYIVGSLDQKFSSWLKEQKERIKSGSDEPFTAEGDPAKDDKNNTDPKKAAENADTAAKTDEFTGEGIKNIDETGNVKTGYLESFSGSAVGGVALKGAAVIGIACALKGVSEAAANLKHDLIVLPLIRMGMEAISVGNQVMSGRDLSLEQLGFFSKQLYSPDKGSWASAQSIQAELGQDQTGSDIPADANPSKINSGGLFTDIIDSIPGIGTVCKAAESGVGKVFTVALSLTTPIATIVQTAVTSTPLFKEALGGLIKWLAGSPIPTMVFGSDYGNMINYGARLGSNNAAASMGGTELSGQQTAELRDYENKALKQEISQRSFAQRMFDIYSPDSLASKTIDSVPGSTTANVASFVSTITNPLKAFSVFKTPFASKVSAAAPYDYGFAKVGFSLEDLNSDTYENPYSNATAATAALAGPNSQTYITRAQNCFGVTVGADGNVKSDMKAQQVDTTDKKYAGYGCNNTDTDWTRIRFYILDMKTAQASTCYDSADTESCQQSGFGQVDDTTSAPPAGTTVDLSTAFQPSDTIACAAGTTNVGTNTGYHDGSPVPIRLCALPNLPSTSEESFPGTAYYVPGAKGEAMVNSRAAVAFLSLVTAAKAAGLTIGASSSFRTMAHQQALFAQNPDPNRVARPGYSNHQMGLAIDFSCNGSLLNGSDPCFSWLSQNAGQYGIKNYPAEAWHWSVTGN